MQPKQKIRGIRPLIWKQTLGQSPAISPSMYISSLLPTELYNTQSFILLVLVSFFILPCSVQAAWFQVGVVGPWGCDSLFAKALPSVAAQLAINRINKDPSLSYAATFDYVVLQVRCCQSVLVRKVKLNVSIIQWVKGSQTVAIQFNICSLRFLDYLIFSHNCSYHSDGNMQEKQSKSKNFWSLMNLQINFTFSGAMWDIKGSRGFHRFPHQGNRLHWTCQPRVLWCCLDAKQRLEQSEKCWAKCVEENLLLKPTIYSILILLSFRHCFLGVVSATSWMMFEVTQHSLNPCQGQRGCWSV